MLSLGGNGLAAFALWPIGSGAFDPWQVVTYAFLHGGLSHLAFNIFGLYMFGGELERVWGPRRFLIFYFISVLGAALAQLLGCRLALALPASFSTTAARPRAAAVIRVWLFFTRR